MFPDPRCRLHPASKLAKDLLQYTDKRSDGRWMVADAEGRRNSRSTKFTSLGVFGLTKTEGSPVGHSAQVGLLVIGLAAHGARQ